MGIERPTHLLFPRHPSKLGGGRRSLASVVAAVVLVGLSACGGESPLVEPAPSESASPGDTPSSRTTQPAYEQLTQDSLESALLEIDQFPPGYSQDAGGDDTGDKTFCDYEQPVEADVRVGRDFTKGGGFSAELVSINLRQYGSAEDARVAFSALTDALETCESEVFEGTELTYTPISAPDLGADAVGVRIDAEGLTLLQNFVLVGPSLLSVGGGGLANADADEVANVAAAQVDRYRDVAITS